MANYSYYREYVEGIWDRLEEVSREEQEKIIQFQDWIKKIEEKLQSVFIEQQSDN